MELNQPFFDHSTTNILKGIAIIMMFVSHFFMFPNWWVDGISYSASEWAKWKHNLGAPLAFCVNIFCFLTGYFYYFNKNKTYKYSLKKIWNLLIPYWVVMFLLMGVSTYFCGYHYTWNAVLRESLALSRPTMIFCWYVNFYILCMLCLPLCVKLMSKNIYFDLFLALILYPIIALVGRFLYAGGGPRK